ncbi:MAG TPA: site-specific integrase [Pyrodictium sp.]|nr:site-specific integrase [Pyrodictium sp.]
MASIFKHGNKWRAQVRIKGKSASKLFNNKREAQRWARDKEIQFEQAIIHGAPPKKTFGDAMRRYAEEVTPHKRSWKKEQQYLLRMAENDPLAAIPLSALGPRHFADWRDRRLRQVKPASVLREWSMLSAVCKKCVTDWEWLPFNPLQNVQRPKEESPRTRRVEGDELERIVFATGYDPDLPPEKILQRVGAAALFAVETAMRTGEIVNMTWCDVDFEKRTVHIPISKNGSARDVPLSRRAMHILKQLKPLPQCQKRCFGMNNRQLDANYRKARSMAMVEGLRFHDLRREALTRLAQKVDVMTLAKISGHRDLRILQNVYYAPDMGDVASKLD